MQLIATDENYESLLPPQDHRLLQDELCILSDQLLALTLIFDHDHGIYHEDLVMGR